MTMIVYNKAFQELFVPDLFEGITGGEGHVLLVFS
jgi:hypothetical protein